MFLLKTVAENDYPDSVECAPTRKYKYFHQILMKTKYLAVRNQIFDFWEQIISTKSCLNYIYQRDMAHDEYEVKRIFATGVAELLFPSDIYHLDMKDIRTSRLVRFRKQIEEY